MRRVPLDRLSHLPAARRRGVWALWLVWPDAQNVIASAAHRVHVARGAACAVYIYVRVATVVGWNLERYTVQIVFISNRPPGKIKSIKARGVKNGTF